MNIHAEIISGKSIGDIEIGKPIDAYLTSIYQENRKVELNTFDHPGLKLHSYKIDDGLITINADENGTILNVSCRSAYEGKYKGVLRPGMSVAQVVAATQKQLLIHGFLVVDNDFGFCFNLPSPYDDDLDHVSELPDDLVLEEVYVKDKEWWR
ncbi:hypothetical protein [Niastella sp. OAS944]|uniref:hypothetical protein n=1 Tax=Niastella sp. OAS944 TaxID=2664089 RepID=UPI00349965F9|nr:hypothetical protein [Chitinophagaceae bacterium OAS944]